MADKVRSALAWINQSINQSINQKRTDYSGAKQKTVSGTLYTVNSQLVT